MGFTHKQLQALSWAAYPVESAPSLAGCDIRAPSYALLGLARVDP